MAQLAFRFPALRSQVGHLFTSSESSPSTTTSASASPSAATVPSAVVSWVASPALHLLELAAGLQDRGVSFLSLPLEERRAAAEIGAKVKSQMSLFGSE
jgi:hypothetical protein